MAHADLHFHSTHSDGKHSVAWLIQTLKQRKSAGLELAVLTDHDVVAGFDEYAEGLKSEWSGICASELSCTFTDKLNNHRELHLLIYGLNSSDIELRDKLDQFKIARETRFFKICDKLKDSGYDLDCADLARKHPGVLGRPHIADALVEKGYASSRSDAFDRFLKDGSPFVVNKWRFDLADAVSYAKKRGCKTSIAHPGQYKFGDGDLEIFKNVGVDALEIYHPRHQQQDIENYLRSAKYYGFFVSGGSDFHTEETDLKGKLPSLGLTDYPLEDAKRFLGDLL